MQSAKDLTEAIGAMGAFVDNMITLLIVVGALILLLIAYRILKPWI